MRLPSARKRIALGFVLLLLICAGVFVLVGFLPQEQTSESSTTSTPAPPTKQTTLVANDADDSDLQDSDVADSVTPTTDAEAPVRRFQPSTAQITLRAVDSNKSSVPLVRFEYAFTPFAHGFRAPPKAMQPAQFNAHGQWQGEAGRLEVLWVRVLEPGWSCSLRPGAAAGGPSGSRAPQESNVFCVRLMKAAQIVELELLKNDYCQLSVEYADGQPFEGEVRLAYLVAGGEAPLRSRAVNYSPGMTVIVPESQSLQVNVDGSRGGFKERASLTIHAADVAAGHVRLVIERDADRLEPCGLILDHTAFAEGQSMIAVLMGRSGSFGGSRMTLVGPGETRSDYFYPGQVFTCVAIGEGTIWSSRQFTLKAGEWRRLTVNPERTSQLSLVVQDNTGKPIGGAVVSAEEVGHAEWGSLGVNAGYEAGEEPTAPSKSNLLYFTRSMTRVRADSEGRAVLLHGWPGTRKYYVEAVGYESELIDVTLEPGRNTDHGVVTLRRATAIVTVKTILPEGKEGTDYHVHMLIPFGGSAYAKPVQLAADGTVTIERVPANKYSVFVTHYPRGGKGWSRRIEIGAGERKDVTIDLTRDYGVQTD
jgi:hypothetical protein